MTLNATIRVYALVFNEQNELLLLNESYNGIHFTKFPGGGLNFGEGTLDTISRELQEELNLKNLTYSHFYTTDFFVPSYFDSTVQVFSVYYVVDQTVPKTSIQVDKSDAHLHGVTWIPLDKVSTDDVTFPIDKKVAALLQEQRRDLAR